MRFKDKVAVITGAGSGQGRAAARMFAAEGAYVAVLDIRAEAAESTAGEIDREGGCLHEAAAYAVDITREADVAAVMEQVTERFGTIDILVNCAGITGPPNVPAMDGLEVEDWMRVLSVNLLGAWLCIKHAVPAMRKQQSGVIINVSSTAGVSAIPGASPYCVSKSAVSMLTKTAALEYIPEGIRVNGILPGHIDTPMMDGVIAGMEAGGIADARERVHTMSNPIKRLGSPEEVAGTILFLASESASFLVGVEIPVDGGYTAG